MKPSRSLAAAFALGLAVSPLASRVWTDAAAQEDPGLAFSRSLQAASARVRDSVVSIEGRGGRGGRSSGSGVLVREDGLLVTNYHVVANSRDFVITLADGSERGARLLGTDSESDLAVLDVEGEGFQPLPLSKLRSPEVGTVVLAIRNPFGFDHTVTSGIISARGRELGMNPYEDFLQTDAAINPGNSGGALVDLQGRLVRINTAVERPQVGNQGLGFAIPTRMVVEVLDGILERGYVQRGWLGVEVGEVRGSFSGLDESDFAFVRRVVPGSPAARSGLEPEDLLLSIDGSSVRNRKEVFAAIASIKPGSEVPVVVWREGGERTLEVRMGERGAAESRRE